MNKIPRRKLYKEVMEQLRQLISDGKVRPGEKFPSEKVLCSQMGVSVAVVREAFRVLEAHGLVESIQGEGRYLRLPVTLLSKSSGNTLEILERSVFLEIMEVREVLETSVAHLAAIRASAEDLQKMKEILELMDAMDQKHCLEQTDLDLDFHCALADSTNNRFYKEIIHNLMDILKDMRQKVYLGKSWRDLSYEHWNIYKAIIERKPDLAVKAMKIHLNGVKTYLD
jgi:GntR family transcriptional repressor for pyruvate dehydrogenase complex